MKTILSIVLCALFSAIASAQCGSSGVLIWNAISSQWDCTAAASAPPSGTAGGDLSGTYPNPSVVKINGTALSGLATGILKNTTTTGVPSIAIPGTDYALPGSSTPGSNPNQTLSGCGVEYVTDLDFTVGLCNYTINGFYYTSPITDLTLDPADMTDPRIDVIAVDDSSAAIVITGTPAASPAAPTIDPATQVFVTSIYVAATATTPTGVSFVDIYEENTEWTSAVTANFNAASTNNPYRGTKDIEATAAVVGNYVTLTKPAAGTEDITDYNNLVFYIRSKATWPSGNGAGSASRYLSIYWLNGSAQVGQAVLVRDGAFGFISSNTSSYQQISIPTSSFGTAQGLVTTLKIQVVGLASGSTSIGFYLDAITLQGGIAPPVLPTTLMNFRGAWSAVTAYNANDVVTSGGLYYVALAANTNVAVTTTATWAPSVGSNAVTSAKMAVVNTRRTSCMAIGANNAAAALANADLGPLSRYFFFPAASTVVEIEVAADDGTPNIIVGRSRAGSIVNLTSGALATAASGGIACSNTGGTTGLDGATTCSSTLQNTAINAGDWLTLVSGTAGGTAKEMTVCVTSVVN